MNEIFLFLFSALFSDIIEKAITHHISSFNLG